MEKGDRRHECMLQNKNKTSTTIVHAAPLVTAYGAALRRRVGLCGYVIAPGVMPFCDRPALPGGSYCACHHALCAVAPASPNFAALATAQTAAADAPATPPPELGWLSAPPAPEPFEDGDDGLAGLDLPPLAIAHDE